MTFIQSVFLSIVQGVTEFLPISSSGHLNLTQYLFRLTPSLTFDIFLNTATLLSVLFFFRKKINYFFHNLKYIIVASIPAGLVGVFLKDYIETLFSNINLLPYFFLITSVLVFSTKYLGSKDQNLNYKKALIIGLLQSFAILPGISRSGATIFAGLLVGLAPINAFNFSFCLFIPASFGALVLGLKDMSSSGILDIQYLLPFVLTFIVGLVALKILQKIVINNKFWIFSVYTFILSILLFFFI
jgi:undecaprenyl-diphosphatase